MITSGQNEQLKTIRKLQEKKYRERLGLFAAEGEDLVEAAEAAGWEPEILLVAGEDVEPELLAAVSVLGSGTRVVGVYAQRWSDLGGDLSVYLHGVHDPGNVGAVLRSAQTFGASCVALGPGTADPYSPKAVRASMGAVFAVPLARPELRDLPGAKIALVPGAGVPLDGLWRSTPAYVMSSAKVLMIGAEREGLPEEVVAGADHVVHIPIQTDSLNAAMAATIALYELSRRMAPE
jgi:RNA methyltransferase, TrmH family